MVCDKCQKNLTKVVTPEVWKAGAGKAPAPGKTNAALTKRYMPYGTQRCTVCRSQLHQPGKYCNGCAYKKGVCSMCGVKVLDVSYYKQSTR
eukprot:tig00021319_g20260.t1